MYTALYDAALYAPWRFTKKGLFILKVKSASRDLISPDAGVHVGRHVTPRQAARVELSRR